ncbi:tripartite tricarboxylate transporter permease [Marinitenerispora sediminis]|uniref:Tripartite tricarboxylate transporter TctA n=1 Tax=Marinitenerispora sediminis TaxID=1931232 RepID=A0A368T480_9ACTN|nr:tripartite tricarboxylate transporter permease [Marinitenerispora sediminis]RCV48861.1 tripartite tricarboxylate transporter TctA [Marinitenerispora sediminis]RCV51279.1 tripartite tricarboxylate transporter TctA [Marinitenerispora sediminis]RCV52926.1 tripartite tricarboxylate transporter TctA [Marinitenerispora sediminis]
MDALNHLLTGFSHALTPENLLWALLGVLLGTAVGVLPGLGSSMAVALLLPITFQLDPTSAFIMLAAVYYGGLFGDSTAAILMNTPGQSSAIATTIEGYKMARRGRAPQALATAAIGAFIGAILSTSLVAFFSPAIIGLALRFGPAEYFALAVFAFIATSAVVSQSMVRGLVALGIGLSISLVGIDSLSGAERFTLGIPQLFEGFSIITITVALLAIGEVLHVAARAHTDDGHESMLRRSGTPWLSLADLRRTLPAWLRGTVFGVPFGVIPSGGSEIPTFLAFGTEKKLAERRARRGGRENEFGKGAIEGVAAPESAGSATAGTAMGALLGLGLPTSGTAAIMLAAFQQYGMQPGPLLFERNGDLVWALLASLFIASVMLLILNLPFAPLWARLLLIPKPYLYAGITVFSVLGVYAASSAMTDLWFMLLLGLVGFMMRRYDIPLAPVLIAVILGPVAESELRRALAVGQGDVTVLFGSAISVGLYAVLLLGGVIVAVNRIRARRRATATVPGSKAGAAS